MNKDQTKNYVDNLNKIKGTIRFTHEYEDNKQLNFLDTTLTRNEIITSIKYNIIKNMTTRIIETTKNKDQQKEDLEKLKLKLKLMLIKSKYLRDKIDKSIQDILRSIINDNNINNNQISTTNKKEKEEKFLYSITLPYIPRIEILKR
ncbi:unnamed protein product [Rotaria sordida]|uniref:Uncharacterized protein n=1 Tax=Rotaria sordida TaxID=392033 RepID=A0A820ANY1_9BILA|nr:unnamed protein product [Rotaria sordida]CAF4194991.1 unnamed protein product [Rotaria sordida]